MAVFLALVVLALTFIVLMVWRISEVVSWRALVQIARATGSLQSCAAFIQFCVRRSSR